MRKYNVNEDWQDPFERVEERRTEPRFGVKMTMRIAVPIPERRTSLVGPGVVRNLSSGGAYLVTKHDLTEGQRVTLSIPTDLCPDSMCLPESFVGTGEVMRTSRDERGRLNVGMKFQGPITQSMDFIMFVDQLRVASAALPAHH
ncbi:MAG: PilZ domain-containing protein [bacterium]|nr:PilZ domain-containing protein [bacterium]